MPFPAPSVTVPSLSAWQWSFNGYTGGAGTTFGVQKYEGIDMPDVRTGDAGRARDPGQFVGLDLLNGRQITITGQIGPFAGANSGLTNLIPDPSFEYDATGTAPPSSLWTQTTSGSITANAFAVSSAWAQSGIQSLHIQGTHSNDTTAETIGAKTPSNTIAATAGVTYTLQAVCNVAQGGPGNGIVFSLGWYTSGGTLISTSTSSVLSAGQLGIVSNSFTAAAPASTAFVQVTVSVQTVQANGVAEFYVDDIALAATGSAFNYFDGDFSTLGFRWAGTPGASSSVAIAGWGRFGSYGSFQGAWSALAAATAPGGTTEQPFFINLPGYGTLVSMCRVRKRSMPLDITLALGNLGNVVLQFNASDPRLYTTPTLNPSVSPPGTTSGFSFPLTFPLSFGGGGVAGSLSVNNTGNIETRPILVVTGPCTNPSITNATAAGSPNLTFNLTMASGDQLVIDTDFHTATYFTSGSTIGSTRLASLAQGSQWWSLAPGANTIQFLTGDSVATGTLNVQYASAYIL